MNPQANSLSKWAQLKKLDSLHCLSDEEAPTSRGTRKLSVSEVSEYSQALNLERESSLSYTALGETGFDTLAQKANRQRRKLLLTANFDDWEQNQPHPHYKRAIKHFSLERCSVLEITDHRILNSTIGKLRKISEQNLSAIYEDLREVYSSLTLDRKKIIKSFAHLILIFQTSITFDLKCLRCKTLLNELTRLETRFFRRSSTRKDRDPKLLNHLSSIEFESRSPDLNKTPDSPYQKPKNGSTPPKTLSRSATMVVSNLKLIKKLFYRARYAFCSIGRFLKYDSKVNPIFNKYADLIHMITGNFEVKSKNFIKDSFQDEGKATMSSLGEIQDFEHNLMNYDYNRAIYSFLDNFLNKIEEADPKTLAHKQNELKGYLVSKKREWIAKIEK